MHPITRPPLDLALCTVTPSPTHKLLGLVLDQELRFQQHTVYAIAKGTNWVMQLCRIVKPMQGLSYHNTHQLFQSITILKMLYAADIWYTPIHHTTLKKEPQA